MKSFWLTFAAVCCIFTPIDAIGIEKGNASWDDRINIAMKHALPLIFPRDMNRDYYGLIVLPEGVPPPSSLDGRNVRVEADKRNVIIRKGRFVDKVSGRGAVVISGEIESHSNDDAQVIVISTSGTKSAVSIFYSLANSNSKWRVKSWKWGPSS